MPIVESRLKDSIVAAIEKCQNVKAEANEAKNILATAIAKAVVTELKNAKIIYISGLTAPSGGGVVTGTFEGKLE